MHPPSICLANPASVRPGAIGHSRGSCRPQLRIHAAGRRDLKKPASSLGVHDRAFFWRRRRSGAGFAQYMLEIEASSGRHHAAAFRSAWICSTSSMLWRGGVDIDHRLRSRPVTRTAGCLCPTFRPACPSRCLCHPTAPAQSSRSEALCRQLSGIATPTAIVGQHQSMPTTNHTGLAGPRLQAPAADGRPAVRL